MKFKIISAVLSAMMLMNCMSGMVFAEEVPDGIPEIPENVVIAPRPNNPLISPNPNPVIAAKPVEDLPESHWAYEEAKRMLDKSILELTEDGKFLPDALLTREMFVDGLWRISGKPECQESVTFEDVAACKAKEAIAWAAAEGIINGRSETVFDPAGKLTREELSKMIYAYVQKFDMGFKGQWMFYLDYTDAKDISEWAFEPMHWVVVSHIVRGITETELAPQGTVTRAQGAVMLSRLLDCGAEKGVDFSAYESRKL